MDLTGASGLTERLRGKPEMVVMDCSTSPLFEIERVELKSRSFSPERAKITLVGTLERLARVGNESLALERRARSVEEVTPSLMKVSEREGNLERRALMGAGRKGHSGLWKLEAGGGGGGPGFADSCSLCHRGPGGHRLPRHPRCLWRPEGVAQ